MTKLKVLLTAGLMLLFASACGSDESKGEPRDSDSDRPGSDETTDEEAGDSDSESEAPGSDETENDAGDGIAGVDACADFMTASWDRIRECESEIAAMLPANEMAAAICGQFCETVEEKVPQETFDACVAVAETLQCDAIPSDITAIISEVPEECAYLSDTLSCSFEM